VAASVADVNTVAGDIANVNSVAGNATNINTVAANNANVTAVANISGDVTSVAADAADIGTVATNISSVNTVAANNANITAVAADATDIGTVASNIASVNTVSGDIVNVNTVAANITDVNAFADTYFISASAPASPTTGDLWYDTVNNIVNVYNGSTWLNINVPTITGVSSQTNTATDFLDIPAGTTAERPGSPTTGNIRFNTTDGKYEAWTGTEWGPLGGGSATTDPLWQHANTASEDYEILSGNNAISGGPMSIASGVTVTVPTGSTWTVV
jgi:hypothetical protein